MARLPLEAPPAVAHTLLGRGRRGCRVGSRHGGGRRGGSRSEVGQRAGHGGEEGRRDASKSDDVCRWLGRGGQGHHALVSTPGCACCRRADAAGRTAVERANKPCSYATLPTSVGTTPPMCAPHRLLHLCNPHPPLCTNRHANRGDGLPVLWPYTSISETASADCQLP